MNEFMENEEKGLVFHFEDEKEVVNRCFSILGFMALNNDSMKFAHNGKEYELDKKIADLDTDPLCVDFYLKLSKS